MAEDRTFTQTVVGGASDADDDHDLLPDLLELGTNAGEYVIEKLLAKGGCGAVYEARHRKLGRTAALKVLHLRYANSAEMIERFEQEARAVNMINHPSIVDIYDLGQLEDGRPFFVMELLRGVSLKDYLRSTGRLSPRETLEIITPICEALGAAHEKGVVHRDVKASNISISNSVPRVVKLLDFGIAKLLRPELGKAGLTTATRRLGSPVAMAPEQINGMPVDGRTDVYALGVLLYYMLTGHLPFDAKDATEVERKHLEAPAPRASLMAPLTPAIDDVILRCLEKTKSRRYPSVRHLLDAFRQAAGAAVASAVTTQSDVMAIYTEVRVPNGVDAMADDVIADLSFVLDTAESALRAAGFLIPLQTSSSILAACVLTAADAERNQQQHEIFAAAQTVMAAIHDHLGTSGRVHANVSIHVGDAIVKADASGAEIVDGGILQVSAWAARDNMADIYMTDVARQLLK